GRVHQRPSKQGAQSRHVNRAIRERVARARPQPSECGRQAESHQRAALGCRQGCIQQLEQTILTKAQAVVDLLPEADKRRQIFGVQHTPELDTLFTKPEDPATPWARLLSKVELDGIGVWTRNYEKL